MAESASYNESFSVPRASLADVNAALAAIDFGCSLVKVVYVPKEEVLDKSRERLTLHCLTFKPSAFDEVLQLLRARVHFPPGAPMRITGVGCTRFQERIEAELGCSTAFVQEFLAAARGTHFLLTTCGGAAFFHPEPPSSAAQQSSNLPDVMQHMLAGMRTKLARNNPEDAPFPALLLLVGSGAGLLQIDEAGRCKMLSVIPVAGRSFLGLSRLLLGTADYAEITALAEKGDARSTALLVRHMVEDDPNSPYGLHDPDLPMQPFAHVPNDDKGLDGYSKEDLAAGLVHMMCSLFFFFSMSSSESTGLNRYYVGGNWTRAESVRTTWAQSYSSVFPDMLHFKFARSGHLGAVGSLITDPADTMKYMLPP